MKKPLYPGRSETYEAFLAIEAGAYKEKIDYIEENFFMLRELNAGEAGRRNWRTTSSR
jgi:hypothetical protein